MEIVPIYQAGERTQTLNEGLVANMNQDVVKNHETVSYIVGSEESCCHQAVRAHLKPFIASSQKVVEILEEETTQVAQDECPQVQSSV